LNDHPDALTNDTVRKILRSRGFFHDVEIVSRILAPIKIAILQLEKRECNMADCFLQLVQLAVSFNNLPNERGLIILKNDCVRIFNKRWSEFDVDPYILAYIIHPQYRGK
jgi:hypothetical protein